MIVLYPLSYILIFSHVLLFHEPSLTPSHHPTLCLNDDGDNHQIDILVGGVGTGGTLTGCGQFLKPLKSGLTIVAGE